MIPDLEGITKELQYILNDTCIADIAGMEWDTFKNQARRLLLSKMHRFKQSAKLILQLTTDKLQELEAAYASDPSYENRPKSKATK